MKASRHFLIATCVAALAGLTTSGGAQIVIQAGNFPQPNEENVLLNNGTTGSTVFGTTQQSNFQVVFTSATQTLLEPSNGQARVEATNGTSQVPLSDIAVNLGPGTFTDLIFNAHSGGKPADPATLTITVTFNTNSIQAQTFNIGAGENYYTITAGGTDVINAVALSAPGGFDDLRQVRMSGASGGNPGGGNPVPTPSSALVLAAGSIASWAGFLRRRHR